MHVGAAGALQFRLKLPLGRPAASDGSRWPISHDRFECQREMAVVVDVSTDLTQAAEVRVVGNAVDRAAFASRQAPRNERTSRDRGLRRTHVARHWWRGHCGYGKADPKRRTPAA